MATVGYRLQALGLTPLGPGEVGTDMRGPFYVVAECPIRCVTAFDDVPWVIIDNWKRTHAQGRLCVFRDRWQGGEWKGKVAFSIEEDAHLFRLTFA